MNFCDFKKSVQIFATFLVTVASVYGRSYKMKVEYSRPVIRDFCGDLSKKWHIYYRVFDPMIGVMKTIRDYAEINSINDLKKRQKVALQKCDEIYERLRNGWRPFEYVYTENRLLYAYERKITSRKKSQKVANSIEAIASEFLEFEKVTESMRQNFISKVRGFIFWLKSENLNNIQMALIDNATIVAFIQYLIDDLQLSGITVKKYRQALLTLWDYAVKKKYASYNIVTNLPVCNREKDKAAKPIREEDLKKLWDVIKKDHQLELACKLELFCLLRPGKEIRFLKVGMIDFDKSVIHLPADIVKNTNPNRRRSKTVTIPNQILNELLDKYRLYDYPDDYYVFGKYGVPGTEHLGKNSLRTRFRNIRKFLKLPDWYKLYSFKHTGVVALIDMNFHPNEIAQQAGWSTTYMLDVYARHKEKSANRNIRDNFHINLS